MSPGQVNGIRQLHGANAKLGFWTSRKVLLEIDISPDKEDLQEGVCMVQDRSYRVYEIMIADYWLECHVIYDLGESYDRRIRSGNQTADLSHEHGSVDPVGRSLI